ncbi:nucleotide sugar dehydrogenase [Streptomyces sp. NPDC102278]|uniref:nucleotide sugar dehydrogenase n=1 Tax=Streptomyces sp. NPDC102278 TaxID=3366152 RepID=UPI003800707B
MHTVIAGQGYVGLPLAVRAAEVGHRVIGYDTDPHRVQELAAGQSHVEDVPSDRLLAVLNSGAYSATADAAELAGYDIAGISVPTPLRDGVADLSHIEACAQTLGEHLSRGATVVLESTTYPGTTEELLVPILEAASSVEAGVDFFAGFSPERIAPNNTKGWSFETTPKLVSGIDAESLDVIKGFYDGIFEITVPVSGPKVVELTKLIKNTSTVLEAAAGLGSGAQADGRDGEGGAGFGRGALLNSIGWCGTCSALGSKPAVGGGVFTVGYRGVGCWG